MQGWPIGAISGLSFPAWRVHRRPQMSRGHPGLHICQLHAAALARHPWRKGPSSVRNTCQSSVLGECKSPPHPHPVSSDPTLRFSLLNSGKWDRSSHDNVTGFSLWKGLDLNPPAGRKHVRHGVPQRLWRNSLPPHEPAPASQQALNKHSVTFWVPGGKPRVRTLWHRSGASVAGVSFHTHPRFWLGCCLARGTSLSVLGLEGLLWSDGARDPCGEGSAVAQEL